MGVSETAGCRLGWGPSREPAPFLHSMELWTVVLLGFSNEVRILVIRNFYFRVNLYSEISEMVKRAIANSQYSGLEKCLR